MKEKKKKKRLAKIQVYYVSSLETKNAGKKVRSGEAVKCLSVPPQFHTV